ncbi:MAG: imidazolonepropionase [Deltaproteobacteria bacterium CG07_land_8_20_14_0_80_38_7]|nr:MAG: imidazolonepropionase [Deltaproteobacteria bacterium CG07_land_8_20_14_0_80_38_7]
MDTKSKGGKKMQKQKILISNIGRLITMNPKKDQEGELEIIQEAALLIEDGLIKWFGVESQLNNVSKDNLKIIDADACIVTPGLIDCHTHIVHGGSRQNEFNLRSQGKKYWEIAKEGGGIMSTVQATRKSSEDELYASAFARAYEALSFGTTSLEVKSGYGLDVEAELKILRVCKKLSQNHALDFYSTFLGAHVVPEEFYNNREEYIDLVINEMLPKVVKENLCQFCDIFVEDGAFSIEEARKIAIFAKDNGLAIRLHVGQFKDLGGAELAAELKAYSADHLDYISEQGVEAMRTANVVATVLPGASYFVGGHHYPPARKMIDNGLKVAIATDYNPGTNPCLNLLLTGNIAATQMNMTLSEVWKGITINAAASLGIDSLCGSIEIGKKADLVVFDAPDEFYPLYRYDKNLVRIVIKNGEIVKK